MKSEMYTLLFQIAGWLDGIATADLTTAEKNIAQLLVRNGYGEFVRNEFKRLPQRS